MCAKCGEAVDMAMRNGLTHDQAMYVIWNETAFPFAHGAYVMKQAKDFVYNRRTRTLTRHNNRAAPYRECPTPCY